MRDDIPSFHDGLLTGIQLIGKDVHLSLRRVNGELWLVTLIGVMSLQMEDFRQGNIVLDVCISHRRPHEKELLDRLFTPPHPSAAQGYQHAHARFLETQIDLVETGRAVMVSIIPAYGADLVAFAEGITARIVDTEVG